MKVPKSGSPFLNCCSRWRSNKPHLWLSSEPSGLSRKSSEVRLLKVALKVWRLPPRTISTDTVRPAGHAVCAHVRTYRTNFTIGIKHGNGGVLDRVGSLGFT